MNFQNLARDTNAEFYGNGNIDQNLFSHVFLDLTPKHQLKEADVVASNMTIHFDWEQSSDEISKERTSVGRGPADYKDHRPSNSGPNQFGTLLGR